MSVMRQASMRSSIRLAIRVLVCGLLFALAATCVGAYRVFFSHVYEVKAILASLPAAERNPPKLFQRVVLKADGPTMRNWVTRRLVENIFPAGMTQIQFNIRGGTWAFLLPTVCSQDDFLALYAHHLFFKDGTGLPFGAAKYFNKPADELSEEEILGLLAISRSPTRYDPIKYPRAYLEEVQRIRSRLNAPDA